MFSDGKDKYYIWSKTHSENLVNTHSPHVDELKSSLWVTVWQRWRTPADFRNNAQTVDVCCDENHKAIRGTLSRIVSVGWSEFAVCEWCTFCRNVQLISADWLIRAEVHKPFRPSTTTSHFPLPTAHTTRVTMKEPPRLCEFLWPLLLMLMLIHIPVWTGVVLECQVWVQAM